MQLTIALEQRFYRTPDGRCWTGSLYPRSFWSRYLTVFDAVKILARVHDAPSVAEDWRPVDGDGVSLAAIPAYVGPWKFVCRFQRVRTAVMRGVTDDSAVLLRVPGLIATLAHSAIQKDRPYGVEVVGDPYDVFSPGANSHPLRPFLRWWASRALKAQCTGAACSLYVTEQTLQRHYPPAVQCRQDSLQEHPEKVSIGVSDVELPSAAFVAHHVFLERAARAPNAGQSHRFRIVFVGMLEVRYKALDVLIAAFAQCIQAGINADLTIIGSGRRRPEYELLARSLGVSDRLTFLGSLPSGEPVRQQLDSSDLFVLPSRVEGLPRALLEAMARGLACIGARVGGVPELLPDKAMVSPGDIKELAARILEFAANPTLRTKLGAYNLETARRYHQDALEPRRTAFYRSLRDLTADWQRVRANRRLRSTPPNPAWV